MSVSGDLNHVTKKQNKHWLTKSWAYLKASDLVKATIASPDKLAELAAKASTLASNKAGALSDVAESLKTALRLVRSYAAREYRDISLQSLGLIVASIIYLVMPIDVLPDFVVGLGLTDDAALLAWTFRSVKDELRRFGAWERSQQTGQQSSTGYHSTNA